MSRDNRAENRDGSGRKRRAPLGGTRLKLTADIPKGYVGRWVNDEDNRIHFATTETDWEFMKDGKPVGQGSEDLNDNLGSYTSQIVGTKEDGSPLRAYLMVIKKEWYEEDQKEKLKPVDEIDNAIRRGTFGQDDMSSEDQSNIYIPKGQGIKIS